MLVITYCYNCFFITDIMTIGANKYSIGLAPLIFGSAAYNYNNNNNEKK